MSTDRVLTWSLTSNALAPLKATDAKGGQSAIYEFEADTSLLAAMPLETEDKEEYFRKAKALIARGVTHQDFAFPSEVLVSPRDKKTPLAISMKRLPGEQLELLLYPAERTRIGLTWGKDEFRAIARGIAKLFAVSEHDTFCQNDTHPGQYLVSWDGNGTPRRVCRVDTLAFSFWHKNEFFGCDKARWEYVAPELHRLGKLPEGLKGYQLSRETDRFGMACLLFEVLTGGKHNEYAGGDPDPSRRVEKKEFAVISMPDGAKVTDAVEEAYWRLPPELTTLFSRALLGDPLKRPGPSEWLQALREKETKSRSWFVPPLATRAFTSRLAKVAKRRLAESGAAVIGVAALFAAWHFLPGGGDAPPVVTPSVTATHLGPAGTGLLSRNESDGTLPDLPPPVRKAKNPLSIERLNQK